MSIRPAVMALLACAAACKGDRAPERAPAPSTPPPPPVAAPPAAPPDAATNVASTVELPSGPAAGLEPPRTNAVVITIAMTGLLVDGAPVITLRDGEADPADKQADGHVLLIPALREAFYKKTVHAIPQVLVVADRRVPMHTLDEVMASLHSYPDAHEVDVAANAGDTVKMLPFEHQANLHIPANRRARHYKPIIGITADKLVLMSTSGGLEPQLTTSDPAELLRTLEATVKKRWPRGKHGADNDEVLVQFDPKTPVGKVVSLAAELRATKLYTQVLLWWPGFDEPDREEQAAAFADLLTTESDTLPLDGPHPRPGADLARQIEDLKRNAVPVRGTGSRSLPKINNARDVEKAPAGSSH